MPTLPRLVASAFLRHVFFCFWKRKNFVVSTFAPNTTLGSNPRAGRRFERIRPSRPHVRPPALNGKRPLPSSSSLLKDVAIPYQASQRRSQRRPIHGFEPEIVFGTKVETKMNLFETDSLFRCSAVRELTDVDDSEYD
jgi:hypothetical protein